MRGLFMDSSEDSQVATIGDGSMFGPALLVAPVKSQGATSRPVYLSRPDHCCIRPDRDDSVVRSCRLGSPTGGGGRKHKRMPSFASLLGQTSGADGDFALCRDGGTTYDYETGKRDLTQLHWAAASGELSFASSRAWTKPDSEMVEVVGK
jgi:alpha-D-xyloside xylohydrolase